MDESDGSGWLQKSRDFAVLGEHERLFTGSCGINITFSILWSRPGQVLAAGHGPNAAIRNGAKTNS